MRAFGRRYVKTPVLQVLIDPLLGPASCDQLLALLVDGHRIRTSIWPSLQGFMRWIRMSSTIQSSGMAP